MNKEATSRHVSVKREERRTRKILGDMPKQIVKY